MRKNYPILLLALFLLAIAFSVGSCSKKIEDIKKNLVIDAMTDGRWLVQTFTDNDTDITSQFASYEFQFYSNGTVTGFKGAEASNGTWVGDPNKLTIYSNFPSANDTVMRLNETWKITNNTFTMVEAKPSSGTRLAFLKLIKKP
jgi:hypothetical protein